jgi:hypothetical protein
LLRAAICIGALASTAACATVTRGTSDTFTVTSVPPGAAVKTTNGFSCAQTPCSFKMSRKSEFGVDVAKPGYQPWHGQVTNKIATEGAVGVAGNVIVGGLIGIGVDAVTGAALDLTPNPLNVTLDPLKVADAI